MCLFCDMLVDRGSSRWVDSFSVVFVVCCSGIGMSVLGCMYKLSDASTRNVELFKCVILSPSLYTARPLVYKSKQ
jgi:hypothetical protein